jgi:hypothetical protein
MIESKEFSKEALVGIYPKIDALQLASVVHARGMAFLRTVDQPFWTCP